MVRKTRIVKMMTAMIVAALGIGMLAGCGKQDDAKQDNTEKETDMTQESNGTEKDKKQKCAVIKLPSELECHDYWEGAIEDIEEKYSADRKNEIIFYGASNFARRETMEEDMPDYKVQNHAFGGSIDAELVGYAHRILLPYEPKIVFFQTGSNDYVQLSGTDEEKVEKCIAYKKEMFAAFHERMPEAKFVIMSGLLLPGRAEYLDLTLEINEQLKTMAEETDYLYYVDANALTYDGSALDETLFVEDGIHLNHEGQMRWYQEYIQPAIEQVIQDHDLDCVRK